MQSAARILAPLVTLTATAMAAVAAWDRGGTEIDRGLLVALSVVICAGTHLLLAISRRPASWALWLGCLLGALYGHLTFFTHASLRAGEQRAQTSRQVASIAREIDATRQALEGIKARAVATVAAELAWTRSMRRRGALEEELAEAKRATALRDELVRLAGTATASEVTGVADPVTARLAAVTGSSEAGISVAVGVGFAILLELVGALLWFEALQPGCGTAAAPPIGAIDHESSVPYRSDNSDNPTRAMARVREAIKAGDCRPTVAGIRVFLGCGQGRALELRRSLASAAGTDHAIR